MMYLLKHIVKNCLINDSMTNVILVKNFDLKMLSYYGHVDI